MKILVCGLPGSGKTWLSERLVEHIDNCAWYNADFVRKYANDWDFELEGRMRQANRMKAFADFEKSNGRWVVCDFVAPTEKARIAFDADFLIWIDTINQGRVVIEKLNQSSMRFYRATEYFEYNGMVVNDTEGGKLSKLVNEKTRLIVLKNHGIIIIAPTIEELFHLTFHFEKCASIQLKIANSREKTNNIRNSIAQKTYNDHNSFGPVGSMSWNAILRTLNLLKKK